MTVDEALASEYRLKVRWAGDETDSRQVWFVGSIDSMCIDPWGNKKHVVRFDDGQVREFDLSREEWRQVCDETKEDDGPDANDEVPALQDVAWFGLCPVTVLARRVADKETEVKISYHSYPSSYDMWVPQSRLRFASGKRERSPRARPDMSLPSAEVKHKATVAVPTVGDEVEVFDVLFGWRGGRVGKQVAFGTIVHLANGEGNCLIDLPIDFKTGDVRQPTAEALPELEGSRVLVPESIFGQSGVDKYAGVIKRVCSRGRAYIFFPIDGKELCFKTREALGWLVDDKDAEATEEWESLVPRKVPDGWPAEVRFCSFPVECGASPLIDQVLLKRKCALSQCMEGVEIRTLPADHPSCTLAQYNRGLFATQVFKRGHCLGQYAGCIQSPRTSRTVRPTMGQYAIHLDLAEGLSYSLELELDAKDIGNEARFINDFRGVAARPNVLFKTVSHPGHGIWVDVFVVAAIGVGDEILVDYGHAFDAYSSSTIDAAPLRIAAPAKHVLPSPPLEGLGPPRPPNGRAGLFELGTLRAGEDGLSTWEVEGDWEERIYGKGSERRKIRRLVKRWAPKHAAAGPGEGAEVGQEDEAELLEAEVEVDVVSNDEGSEEDAQVKIDEVLSDTETAQHTSRKGRKHKQRKSR